MPLQSCDLTATPTDTLQAREMPLGTLPQGRWAKIVDVTALHPDDEVAQRLRNLGFVPDEPVQVIAHAPWGRDPILVEIGTARFALRHAEANRVTVTMNRCA